MSNLPTGTVTFLLGDVEGSTHLAARLGDSYAQVLKRGIQLARRLAEANGGHFLNSEGDSFLLVFPSATAAVRAAIEAQRALAQETWPDESIIKIRMGIHSGEASGTGGDYSGLDVNRTARVANAGHGGQILLSSMTRKLVDGRLPSDVSLLDVGAFALEGIEEPEQLWQVAAADLPTTFPPPRAASTIVQGSVPVVGRVSQLGRIGAALDDVIAGHGRLILITGDAGMGKTRICDEITIKARARSVPVLWGRCWEGPDAPLYWPWVQVIQPLMAQGSGLSDVQQAQLAHLNPAADRPAIETPEVNRFLLFDAVVQLLRNRSSSSPLVLIFDDTHAADDSSLQLLQFVARGIRSMRVLFLVTYRESAITGEVARESAFGSIEREGDKISLPPLSETDVASLIEEMTGAPGGALAPIVLEASEGNPLFVREIMRLFSSGGELHRPDESMGFLVPEGAREVLKRRLGALSDESMAVVTAASAVGRSFALETLQLATGLEIDDLLKALEEAQQRGVIRQTSALGRYAFGHVLLREALYESMPSSDRMRLHRTIAEALEADPGGDPTTRLAEIAHHFFKAAQAGDMRKTLEYNRKAGDAAEGMAAFTDAARHYKRAMLAADLARVDESVRAELRAAIRRVEEKASAPIKAAE